MRSPEKRKRPNELDKQHGGGDKAARDETLRHLFLIVVGIVLLGVRGPLLIVVLSMAGIEIIWLLSVPETDVPSDWSGPLIDRCVPAREVAVSTTASR